MDDVSRETELRREFSSIAGLDEYAAMLSGAGVDRGLIGPREAERLWSRHIANCAVVVRAVTAEVPCGATVIDVGSGAGLPGIVWALVRPDLHLRLLEPLLRRSTFLSEVVTELDLHERVEVIRVRAEDYRGPCAPVVTARAVANLASLAKWTLPLTCRGGWLLALKGSAAEAELGDARDVISRLGGGAVSIKQYGVELLETPTCVVSIRKVGDPRPARPGGRSGH